MKRKTRNRLILFAPLLCVALGACLFNFAKDTTSTIKGVSYIKKLEEKPTKALSRTLTDIRNDEQERLIQNGTISVFDLFHDYVIYGDSRVCGFVENGFLPASRIFAKAGDGIRSIPSWDEQLNALKPAHIYFLYGINELDEIKLDKGADYKEEYTTSIRKVMSSLPESHIYVCSIIPVSSEISESKANRSYEDVPAYNRILEDICDENGWTFINMDTYVSASYYQADGIHFKKEFYPIWAQSLIAATED
ncbi:MAG: hypothetical protein KBT48_04885 [Firmicutes bacterium]|nr:hypothetical protein [Bacillota bacterium]